MRLVFSSIISSIEILANMYTLNRLRRISSTSWKSWKFSTSSSYLLIIRGARLVWWNTDLVCERQDVFRTQSLYEEASHCFSVLFLDSVEIGVFIVLEC